jgi:hypothetical protein
VSGEQVNFITRKPYRGINPFILISSGFSCPYWISFKQAKEKGGRIKKEEHGFPVVFWKWIEGMIFTACQCTFSIVSLGQQRKTPAGFYARCITQVKHK